MSEDGFLSRWSRRKRDAQAGRPAEEPEAPPAVAAPSPAPAPASVSPPGPAFDVASLPRIDSLTAGSDFTAFLRKEVPEAIKRAALRKAWALDPAIRDFIGPADYAWDYNAPDGVPGFSLELKGDIAKLLAQAMGLDDPRAPPAPVDEVDPPPAGLVTPRAPTGLVTPPVAVAEAPAAVSAAPEPAPGPVRRHGSALPC